MIARDERHRQVDGPSGEAPGLDEPTRIAVAPAQSDRVRSLLDDLHGMHSEDVEKRDEEIARLEAKLAVTLDGDSADGE